MRYSLWMKDACCRLLEERKPDPEIILAQMADCHMHGDRLAHILPGLQQDRPPEDIHPFQMRVPAPLDAGLEKWPESRFGANLSIELIHKSRNLLWCDRCEVRFGNTWRLATKRRKSHDGSNWIRILN